jgi:hypothetical protein
VSTVVSIVHNSLHYAVVEIDIPGKHVVIFDGLYRPLLHWMNNVVSSLKQLWLVAVNESFTVTENDEFTVEKMRTRHPVTSPQGYILTFDATP